MAGVTLNTVRKTYQGGVEAVKGVSFAVPDGAFCVLVGPSGCGKSTLLRMVAGLERITSGEIAIGDRIVNEIEPAERDIAMVFQDPLSALNPVHTIGRQISEALHIHSDISKDSAMKRAIELLEIVGIPRPAERAQSYAHEFSGGMRQRVMIALAIANRPQVILADEPTTALDVTVQAQILDVLKTARDMTGAAVVLVTHDLGIVAGLADRVAIMYGGKVVEIGDVNDVYASPAMPYTIGLLRSIPRIDGLE